MDEKKENTYVDKVGKVVGGILVTCIAACGASIFIALTIKFVSWILF